MDFSNWSKYKWHYVIIVIVVTAIIVWIYFAQYEERNGPPPGSDFSKEGNGCIYYKGRGSEDDSVAVLLDRLEWLSRLERRITWWQRMVIPTAIVTVLVILIVFRGLPTPTQIILLIIVIFLPFILFHAFYHTHGDYYMFYYVRKDTQLIRDKLKLVKGIAPDPTSDDIPDRVFLS